MTAVDGTGGDELHWEPPGPGVWFPSAEHMPTPGCQLLVELLPHASTGWQAGADRYGLLPNGSAFGASNRWFFFSPGVPVPPDVAGLDERAEFALVTKRWTVELAHWHAEVRPAVVAESRALLAAPLPALDDAALAGHVQAAVDHFRARAPMHFAAVEGSLAIGALLEATAGWGLDGRAVIDALAGSGPASSSAARLLERIATGLRAAGAEPTSLGAVHAVGGDVAAALDELVVDYAWRAFGVDLLAPTLAERPAALCTAIRGTMAGGTRRRPDGAALGALRERVPVTERDRFDGLAAEAGEAYGYNDDNSTVLFSLPLGLLRRAVLEVGHRLVERGRLVDADDAFEAGPTELVDLLGGAGPSAVELSDRAAHLRAMARLRPPGMLGSPPEPMAADPGPSTQRLEAMLAAFRQVAWARGGDAGRAAVCIGTEVVRGRAVVVVDPVEALERMEPGDVLVAVSTTATFNTIFPLAGAVAVQEGSLMSHPAVLARELGLTAVIGIPDLLQRIADGDLVEVDPVAGTIRVVRR